MKLNKEKLISLSKSTGRDVIIVFRDKKQFIVNFNILFNSSEYRDIFSFNKSATEWYILIDDYSHLSGIKWCDNGGCTMCVAHCSIKNKNGYLFPSREEKLRRLLK